IVDKDITSPVHVIGDQTRETMEGDVSPVGCNGGDATPATRRRTTPLRAIRSYRHAFGPTSLPVADKHVPSRVGVDWDQGRGRAREGDESSVTADRRRPGASI